MQVAQSLYENGHITYMRTDSTTWPRWRSRRPANWWPRNTATSICRPRRGSIRPRSKTPRKPTRRFGRPAIRSIFPRRCAAELSPDEFKLYDLIWKRTVASQMADARGRRITITVEGDGAVFQVGGKTIEFPGYLRAYVEGSRRSARPNLAERETVLPSVAVGEALACRELEPKSHTTQPPDRYSEASLTRALEEMGIGRPSTYASIIDTILAREYVFKISAATCWCPPGSPLPCRNCSRPSARLVDYQFTAADGRRPGRHQPRRDRATSTTCGRSTSATSIRA